MSRSSLSACDVGYSHWSMWVNWEPLSANHKAEPGDKGGALAKKNGNPLVENKEKPQEW